MITQLEMGGFVVTVVGVGDVIDEDGRPAGRGILIEMGGSLNEGRHKFFLQATEDTIRRFSKRIGKAYTARVLLDVHEPEAADLQPLKVPR